MFRGGKKVKCVDQGALLGAVKIQYERRKEVCICLYRSGGGGLL